MTIFELLEQRRSELLTEQQRLQDAVASLRKVETELKQIDSFISTNNKAEPASFIPKPSTVTVDVSDLLLQREEWEAKYGQL